MSNAEYARRTDVQIVIKGSERTITMNKDWASFTYVDNEEDEADDFQLKTHDREGTWLRKYLSAYVEEQATAGAIISSPEEAEAQSGRTSGSSGSSSSHNVYKVTSSKGLNVRSGAGEKYKILGKLTYGDYIEVQSFSNGWAKITYAGKTAYVKGETLVSVGASSSSGKSSSNSSSGTSGEWAIGDEVICSGRPQYSSYGDGKPGSLVSNHKGKITHLNLKTGIPYPICVDYLGWFAINQVQKVGDPIIKANTGNNSTVSKGVKLSASIVLKNAGADGKDKVLDCGLFELDSVELQGPPSSLTIKGTSLSYASTIRQTLKSKSWENMTLQGIANTIASANGMAVMFESSNNPKYARAEQYRTSDIAFLQKLCHDAGCSLKAANNIIVIFDQATYESKSAVRTIRFGDGTYTKYKLSTGTNNCYTSCRVYYTNSSGVLISATEYAENYREGSDSQQCLEVKQRVSSIAEAQELAHKLLRLHNKFENEATFTLPGDTDLVAGCVVALKDFGMWDGSYIISKATHTVSTSGYTTQVQLRKVLKDNVKVTTGNTTAAEETMGDTKEQIHELAMQVIRGDWGNGQVRKDKLKAAGHDYATVQAEVNRILYG